MSLSMNRRKRRPGCGPEPPGRLQAKRRSGPCFVIQNPAPSSDHYDLCLEIDGLLVSWAIPKGPSTSLKAKRMVRRAGNRPLEHQGFDDTDPDGEHGAGVVVFDRGTYTNATGHAMGECLRRGHVSFYLRGEKVSGGYALTRIREGRDETWLLIKRRDDEAEAPHQDQSRPGPVPPQRTPEHPEHNEVP